MAEQPPFGDRRVAGRPEKRAFRRGRGAEAMKAQAKGVGSQRRFFRNAAESAQRTVRPRDKSERRGTKMEIRKGTDHTNEIIHQMLQTYNAQFMGEMKDYSY